MAILCAVGPLSAAELVLPQGAQQTARTASPLESYRVPTGPWREETGLQAERIEGAFSQETWRLDGTSATTLQILAPVRDQLVAQGYEILLDCRAQGCGGFDFRFSTRVAPGPEMYVNLTDFRFLSARNAAGDYVTLLVSRDNRAVYLQVIRVAAQAAQAPEGPIVAPPSVASLADPVVLRLERNGHVVLADVDFDSGSAALAAGEIASLDAIATFLQADPGRRMLFVGHTDATGSLEGNRALSQRRAEAVVAYLRDRHAITKAQIVADGAGYLAPVGNNLTPEGREANRRVEAVLLPSE